MRNIGEILQRNTKRLKLAGARSVMILALFLLPNMAYASTLTEIWNQIQATQSKLNQTTGQKKTLQGEINGFNRQISSVQSQIYATDAEISRLTNEIQSTETMIVQAETELTTAREQLSEILRVTYEEGQVSDIELIARSNNFSDFLNKSEYLEQIQLKIKDSADKVIALKAELDAKKKILEESKKKTIQLKNEQLAQRSGLDQQKRTKDALLSITKGDEAEYKKLIKELQTDYNEELQKTWSSGNFVSQGRVSRGDIIGYEGNSGLSTGAHTHFEYRPSRYSYANPWTHINNGTLGYPMPGAAVTQDYGWVCWWINNDGSCGSPYVNNLHTGIDFSKPAGTAVLAATDGDIVVRISGMGNYYSCIKSGGSRSYCKSVAGGYGNYVIIQNDNGTYTLYGHLQ